MADRNAEQNTNTNSRMNAVGSWAEQGGSRTGRKIQGTPVAIAAERLGPAGSALPGSLLGHGDEHRLITPLGCGHQRAACQPRLHRLPKIIVIARVVPRNGQESRTRRASSVESQWGSGKQWNTEGLPPCCRGRRRRLQLHEAPGCAAQREAAQEAQAGDLVHACCCLVLGHL